MATPTGRPQHSVSGVRSERSLRQGWGVGRLASLGLVALLVFLPSFALWGAFSTYRAGEAARAATVLSDAFEEARYAVGAEESLERKYRLDPSPEIHQQTPPSRRCHGRRIAAGSNGRLACTDFLDHGDHG